MRDALDDRLRNAGHRATLAASNDNGNQQLVDYDGMVGEKHTGVVRIQQYGFSGFAPAGSEGVMVPLGGMKDMSVFVGGEHPGHRPTGLTEGQVKVYDRSGTFIWLDDNGNLNIETPLDTNVTARGNVNVEAAGNITLKAPNIVVEGNLTVSGDITNTGNMSTGGTHSDANGSHRR